MVDRPAWMTAADLIRGLQKRDPDGSWVTMSGAEVRGLWERFAPSTGGDDEVLADDADER